MSRAADGVIKFDLVHSDGVPPAWDEVAGLCAWRQILYRLGLVGLDPKRYGGVGYGNLSCRVGPFAGEPAERRFLITGTQTGGLARLNSEHFTLVRQCHPARNRVVSEGPVRPSSEALTHGALYGADHQIRAVFHAHSPEIWQAALALGLPVTDHRVVYGTPEMAAEMRRLYADPAVRDCGVIVMGGHEDGVVSFGPGLETAGQALIRTLARAMALIR
ncbi:ribulose-5-phosphate 4-epimerase/fuculose-1-phosphate aldolase [Geothermobacter ehrlichii]|uniref:Ribulose-5-phosphate 4-epimerase/fuculose-1-phosphate aldolase n=1 Tax=Geothermobacter ehrlichii TaxID=213224 RepID=A0A5D3WM46_9BACT|nr:class II aldolase/adducin family protein [Geothermobacter ehrlichii]TYO98579.1 ribulose-5-phosphate 4-epimerase/fuculose-1-phosphate aldolase [Geothermobacter ehrlichii]